MRRKLLSCLILGVLYLFLSFSMGQALGEEKTDLILKWEQLASRADEVIAKAEASNDALKVILSDLTSQRKEVYAEQLLNSMKISKFSEELEALGPPPSDLEIESLNISKRRKSLNLLIDAANVPFLAANAMLKRTDFLIDEINAIMRERLTRKLFSFGASPLDFTFWSPAFREFLDFFGRMKRETFEIIGSQTQRKLLVQKFPLILLFTALIFLGFFIHLKGVVFNTVERFGQRTSVKFVPAIKVGLSGISFAILFSSVLILIEMLKFSGLFGFHGTGLLNAMSTIAIVIITGKWLSKSLLFVDSVFESVNLFHDEKVIYASRLVFALGVILSLNILMESLASLENWTLETQAVLNFPIIGAAGFFLFKLTGTVDPSFEIKESKHDEQTDKNSFSLLRFTKNLLRLISVVAPILAISGYFYAAQKLIYPSIFTLGLASISILLFVIFREFLNGTFFGYENVTIDENKERVALSSIFIALLIILVNIPIVGLIWGAELSDLYEVWIRLNEGLPLGSARLTLPGLISLIVVFAIGYGLTRLFQRVLQTSILPNTSFDTGGKNAIVSGVGYAGIILATMAAISSTGLDLSSLAIVAGALSVGLGFGLQTIVSNFVSGIILLIERPIKEGDWIEVAGFSGTVRKISVRSTQIQTFDRGTVIVPNSELISGSVLNYTHSNLMGRVRVPIGVAYGTDPRKVEKILLDLAEVHPRILKKPAPSVVFMGFGSDSLNFEIRAFMKDVGYVLAIKSDLNFEIVKAFQEEGIEIPFAQRDVTIKNLGELKNNV